MCGRFTLTESREALQLRFQLVKESFSDYRTRYNLAPQQDAPVIIIRDGVRVQETMRWGLIPFWAKDPSIGNSLINARAETLAEKPSFKHACKRRRCLIPADGFYEWRKGPGKKKTPVRITLKSGKPFVFAGLWETWQPSEGEKILSFTIITTEPNELIKPIHHRMPVILHADAEDEWLNTDIQDTERLSTFLKPYPAEEMKFYEVSDLVNSAGNDVRQCILPL